MYKLEKKSDFEGLSPDVLIDAVEEALGIRMSGLAYPLASYINRVYELQAMNGTRYVAKFYRPGRWSEAALIDEHNFVSDCKDAEIPVIAPILLKNNSTMGKVNDIFFAVFPKRLGRRFEAITGKDWIRIGSILGRLHNVGVQRKAKDRIIHDPLISTVKDINFLKDGFFVSPRYMSEFRILANEIMDTIGSLFIDVEYIRVHGDCHFGNILFRPGEGMMLIDFDDMMTAPPVQDIWLILQDYSANSKKQLDLILKGYTQFRDFDISTLKLIEPLRLMRLIYFLGWCAKQENDLKFKATYPNWGSDTYWRIELNDLQKQLDVIKRENNSIQSDVSYCR